MSKKKVKLSDGSSIIMPVISSYLYSFSLEAEVCERMRKWKDFINSLKGVSSPDWKSAGEFLDRLLQKHMKRRFNHLIIN